MSSDGPSNLPRPLALALRVFPLPMVAVRTADGALLAANEAFVELAGRPADDIIGAPLHTILPGVAMRDGRADAFDAVVRQPSGTAVPVRVVVRTVEKWPEFAMVAALPPAGTDAPDHRFHLAVEAAPSGMLMSDARGRIVLVNSEAERLLGWPRDELLGQSIEVLVPERLRAEHVSLRAMFHQEAAKRPMGYGRDLTARRKDGSEIAVEIGLTPIDSPEGTLVLSSIVDVSARREAARALQDSEERFRLLVDGVRDYALVLLDPAGRVMSWNAGAERIKGYAADEILGRPWDVFFTEADRAAGVPVRILETARSEGRFEGEQRRLRKDGTMYLGHMVVTALTRADGTLRGFANVTRDVSEQHRLEETARQAQKMQAIGTLAGGIAHDFNNILTAIVGYTELVRADLDPRGTAHEDLTRVLGAAERGRELVRRILAFGRRQDVERATMKLDDAVREAVELLRASLPSTIEFRTHFALDAPPVLSNPMLVHQVAMNLCTNAAQAMSSDGGVLEVSVDPVHLGEVAARRIGGLRTGNYVRLRVADTGHGMPPEVLRRAAEPFFTTKAVGNGTGLGLSVVHGIVQEHGGALDIRSAPGQGTTVDVYLPATTALASDPLTRVSPELVHGTGQHVLLVDDEEVIAAMTRRQLESIGYRVTPFTSSVAALAAFRREPHAFDLLVTDNTMPVLTGLALTTAVHAVRPDLPVLMVSGFGDGVDVQSAASSGVRRLLPKPYSLLRLSEAVAQALQSD